MPNLADSLQCSQFVTKLVHCERFKHLMYDWEQTFVDDMRESFDSREDASDMGAQMWNPSSNQINTLSEIAGAYK